MKNYLLFVVISILTASVVSEVKPGLYGGLKVMSLLRYYF